MGRREAILLALSAGTILLGRQGADAAALAPAEDPESPFKGFILPNAPGRDRNKISVCDLCSSAYAS